MTDSSRSSGRSSTHWDYGRSTSSANHGGTIVAAEYALRFPERLASLVLADPCLSIPRYAAGAADLRAVFPADVQAVLRGHEAAGTMDSEECQDPTMKFYRRRVC